MPLLHSCTLRPQGTSSLAAVRFNHPIRVESLRIFPKGARPFKNVDLVAETEPETFYLDVYFNAHNISTNSKEKQRATNALVPTTISYPGGHMDFTVDMGTEYATRLMIVKGKFDKLTMAIYGQVVTEPPTIHTYEPRPIIPPEPLPLRQCLDPSQSSDPTILAKNLLSLVPNAPSLTSAIRLMFCLKPSDEDWDEPEFPRLYADLENENEDYDLDSVVQTLNRPIPDDVSTELLDRFVERLNEFVGPANLDQAYSIANVLNISASQDPYFAPHLLKSLDFDAIFDTTTLSDTANLGLLTHASSNASIARYLLTETNLVNDLDQVYTDTRTTRSIKQAIDQLKSRIYGWQAFEDCLSNSTGNFSRSVGLLYEVGKDEESLGNWLECMMIHPDIVAKLETNPIHSNGIETKLPILHGLFEHGTCDRDEMMKRAESLTHDEFIRFVRVCLGIASVLAVLAWADSVGNDQCRERTLAVLYLWQGIQGFREILNHFLLLRQLSRRLNWIITDNDPPRKSALLAEQILSTLISSSPSSILNEDLVERILTLPSPPKHLLYISEDERLLICKMALVVDDGLPAAIKEVFLINNRPFSIRRLRIVRVAIGIIFRALKEGDDTDVEIMDLVRGDHDDERGSRNGKDMDVDGHNDDENGDDEHEDEEKYRQEIVKPSTSSDGFMGRLIDLFNELSEDLNLQFILDPNTKTNHALTYQLFSASAELLSLILFTESLFPITAYGLRKLTSAVADVFVCTDEAESLFSSSCTMTRTTTTTSTTMTSSSSFSSSFTPSSSSQVCLAARKSREKCLEILRRYSKPKCYVEPSNQKQLGAEIVLKTLLVHTQSRSYSHSRSQSWLSESSSKWDGDEHASNTVEFAFGGHDPDVHSKQVFCLIDLLLPSPLSLPLHCNSDSNSDHLEVGVEAGAEEVDVEIKHWVNFVLPKLVKEIKKFMDGLTVEDKLHVIRRLIQLDENGGTGIGIGEWLVGEEVKGVVSVLESLVKSKSASSSSSNPLLHGGGDGTVEEVGMVGEQEQETHQHQIQKAFTHTQLYRLYTSLHLIWLLANPANTSTSMSTSPWFFENIVAGNPELAERIGEMMKLINEGWYTSPVIMDLIMLFGVKVGDLGWDGKVEILIGLLRLIQDDVTSPTGGVGVLDVLNDLMSSNGERKLDNEQVEKVRLEIGRLCSRCAEHMMATSQEVAEVVFGVLCWLVERKEAKVKVLRGVQNDELGIVCDCIESLISSSTPTVEEKLKKVKEEIIVDEDLEFPPLTPIELPTSLTLSLQDIQDLLELQQKVKPAENGTGLRPSTPKGTKTPDILGTIISPPTALLRSPAATGLTKTYANNDFRQLRQVPSARLNTSRLPSMHVDDFEGGPIPGASSASPLVVPVPIPVADVTAFGGLLGLGGSQ